MHYIILDRHVPLLKTFTLNTLFSNMKCMIFYLFRYCLYVPNRTLGSKYTMIIYYYYYLLDYLDKTMIFVLIQI